MKRITIFIFIALTVTLLWPATVYAKDTFEDKVVFGGVFTLEAGEIHDGNLVVFGGAVTVEPESTLNGDLVLIGGTVEVGGLVQGSVVGIGGAVRLNPEAEVNGDVVTIGATLRRDKGALVNGQVFNGVDIPSSFIIPDDTDGRDIVPPVSPQTPSVSVNTNPFLKIIWFFFRTFLYAALAVVVVMFLAEHVGRISQAAITQPVITAGAGLLTAVLAPLALVVITITIILIPVTLVSVILLIAAWMLGWVALGLEVGRRVAKALNIKWAPAISAGVGTLALFFVLGGLNQLIPCIGWIPQTLIGLWGLGAVLLTRFGTQDYPALDQIEAGTPDLLGESIPDVNGDVGEPGHPLDDLPPDEVDTNPEDSSPETGE